MRNRETEVLAPAGSYECLEAAVQAGADAVYLGGRQFGARAFAANFDREDLLRALEYVHLRGRKLYLTVNTLLKDREIEELEEYLMPFYREGLDAVIVQDLGVLDLVRERFPDLAVHISTQMTVTSEAGARFFKDRGATRIVPARELSLEEIRRMKEKSGLEMECFVHGAMCYCYSGQCLMSSLIGGRSGNRGQCAQPCRLPYRVEGGKQQDILSMKDLCALSLIPELIEAGVDSFKIEGRMKQPDYVWQVARMYRKYTDLYYARGKDGFRVDQKDLELLQGAYRRRGYCDGYYHRRNGREMISFQRPQGTQNEKIQIPREKNQEKINGILILSTGNRAKLELDHGEIHVEVEGDLVQQAQNQPLDRERVERQMRKTGDEPFCFQELKIRIEGEVFLPMQALNSLRREGIGRLKEAVLSAGRREPEAPAGEKKRESFPQEKASGFLVRVETRGQLEAALAAPGVGEIILDGLLTEETEEFLKDIKSRGKSLLFAMPHLFREDGTRRFETFYEGLARVCDGALIRNWESCQWLSDQGFDKKIYSDANLYGWNQRSRSFLAENGIWRATAPVELNRRELAWLGMEGTYLIIYGYLPVMLTANCIQKSGAGCSRAEGLLFLEDRQKKKFPVKNCCRYCYNIIYNCAPLDLVSLADEVESLDPAGLRIDLTFETKEEAERILKRCYRTFVLGEKDLPPEGEYTRGHFKRGVK
nr:U32 family peptidase [Massilistercora timonensis]